MQTINAIICDPEIGIVSTLVDTTFTPELINFTNTLTIATIKSS